MEKIYLLEDVNGLKYVGRTTLTLNQRFRLHKVDKKRDHTCSSKKLDLDHCERTCIDIADSEEEAHQLEEFYINSINCVNDHKLNFDRKEYREKNRDEINKKQKAYREKNKDEINRKQREARKKTKFD